jgi:CheY-like chemotaxis protein
LKGHMKKRILIVDDTETVLMFEKMMLAGEYDVRVAKTGKEALRSVAESRPDIILLDIVMPEMDGISTCRQLKNDVATKDIPVIIVTTKGETEKVEAAFTAGCNDYLTKPINRLNLLEKINEFLGQRG